MDKKAPPPTYVFINAHFNFNPANINNNIHIFQISRRKTFPYSLLPTSYSYLSDSAGLVLDALNAWKLTVITAIISARIPPIIKGITPIPA